ncbi:hypothetical protein [uncultured Formosa sp.]|uniref:hypothetical protein n=1 Tax=uncultured Formosa sp. TaxID=255435 RepID=UPI00262E149D|nr:hypothetical protein [uncultured Formosa sp.]
MKKLHFILFLACLNLCAYSCSPDAIVSDENTSSEVLTNCCGDDGEIEIPLPDDKDSE